MRTRFDRAVVLLAVIMIAAAGSALAAKKFVSTWTAPDAGPLGFQGKKVVALIMTDDQDLQVSAEEALAAELSARGVDAVPAYRLVPRELLRDRDQVKAWFTRAKVHGVVVMRVVGSETQVSYTPDLWATPYYGTLWGYYGYGWGTMYVSGSVREDLVLGVETLVFKVPEDKLVWAGVSEKTNPKGAQQVVKDLVKESIQEMSKVGLVPKGAK